MIDQRRESSPPGQRDFEDLIFYQEALNLVRMAYRLAEKMPQTERYNMADQIRRASVSVTNNIAEGYGRYHFADRIRFMYISRGSLDETLSVFITANVVGFCDEEEVENARKLVHNIKRGLNGYITYIRKQRQGADLFSQTVFREEPPPYFLSEDPSGPDTSS